MMRLDWDSPIAKPLAGLVAVVVVAVAIGACMASHYRAKATQAEAQANVSKGEADAAKAQAQAKDAEIAAQDSRLAEARSDVARKVAELAAYRASHPATSPVAPAVDEPVQPGVADLAPLVRKQDEVIQAQGVLIRELDARVFDLTVSRDSWKASADARERESVGLRIALEAQKSLTKSALWKGRIQGIALGLSVGYVGGRLQ